MGWRIPHQNQFVIDSGGDNFNSVCGTLSTIYASYIIENRPLREAFTPLDLKDEESDLVKEVKNLHVIALNQATCMDTLVKQFNKNGAYSEAEIANAFDPNYKKLLIENFSKQHPNSIYTITIAEGGIQGWSFAVAKHNDTFVFIDTHLRISDGNDQNLIKGITNISKGTGIMYKFTNAEKLANFIVDNFLPQRTHPYNVEIARFDYKDVKSMRGGNLSGGDLCKLSPLLCCSSILVFIVVIMLIIFLIVYLNTKLCDRCGGFHWLSNIQKNQVL